MPFLKKPPVDLNTRRIDLQQRLQNAETALETLRRDAVASANDDPDKLADMASAAFQAEFESNAIRAALDQLDIEIAQAAERTRLADDRKVREQTSRDLNAMADRGIKIIRPLVDALAAVHVWLQDDAEAVLGVVGMKELTANLHRELPPGIELMAAEIRARADATLAGRAPATLPAPPILEVVREEPPPPTIQVFALERLSWLDERGQRRDCGPFSYHALPPKAAKIALARGLALEPDSMRVKEILSNKHGLPHLVDPMKTYDLDRDPNTVEVFRGGKKIGEETPQFQPYDRGPPRQVFVTRPPEPEPR
jgi:hypothetical protein